MKKTEGVSAFGEREKREGAGLSEWERQSTAKPRDGKRLSNVTRQAIPMAPFLLKYLR